MSSILSRFVIPDKPPPRLVLMGDPKAGKSTFASSAPAVAMVMAEDGALGLDVPQLRVSTWRETLEAARAIATEDHSYEWAAFDTANAIEALCSQHVCDRDFDGRWLSSKGKEGYNAYGKGDKATAQEFRQLLGLMDTMQQKRGMGIILLCHVGLHKTANALGADFVKFGGDLNKNTWALIAGWADQIGWATREFRASIREGEQRAKASAIGAAREIVFEGSPGLDAGCRAGYEMPERILLDWAEYEKQLSADHIGDLVAQALAEIERVPDDIVGKVKARLGGKITAPKLREIGKQNLNALIGWLITQRNNSANNAQEA